MQSRFRIRYDDEGRHLGAAMVRLDRLAETALEVVWVGIRGAPALLMGVAPEQEALLIEGLTNDLPGARICRESVDHVLDGLPRRSYVTRLPEAPGNLLDLLDRFGALAIRCSWKRGRLAPLEIASRDRPDTVRARVQELWPGARVWPVRVPAGLKQRPSDLWTLPPAGSNPTLASRNTQERPFSRSHADPQGVLVGAACGGEAVRLARGARCVWVGSPARTASVAAWTSQQWPGRVLVLDAAGRVPQDWQDAARAGAYVSWSAPGQSTHINPLTRLPTDSLGAYVARVMAWLASLSIDEAIVGPRMVRLLRIYVKLMAGVEGTLTPPVLLPLLGYPADTIEPYRELAPEILDDEEMQVWRMRGRDDAALLTPGFNVLRSLFDQYPEMALWLPPFLPAEVLASTPWTILRVPTHSHPQRIYWAGMWGLLEAVYGAPDVLMWGLGLDGFGQDALRTARASGATALLWGETLLEAVGTQSPTSAVRDGADLLAGAGPGAQALARHLGVPGYILAAQAEGQAVLMTDGDVGSVQFVLPRSDPDAPTGGWPTHSRLLPPVLGVSADEDAAADLTTRILCQALEAGRRLLILSGDRALWPALAEATPSAALVPAESLPMLNPLAPRDVHRWVWWARGLGLSSQLMHDAFRAGITDLQGLLGHAQAAGDSGAVTTIREALHTCYFGWNEIEPEAWFEAAAAIAVESRHPALTRTLLLIGIESGAQLVLWKAPGLVESDVNALVRARAIVYPDPLWMHTLLVGQTHNGTVAVLPARIQNLVAELGRGEALLYRRGGEACTKVRVDA